MQRSLMRRSAMVAALAACFPAYGAVARVEFVAGEVTAVGPDGRSRALAKGSEIDVRDTVRVAEGRAQLRFTDGAYMSLQPRTEFVVDEYRFAGKEDGGEGVVMRLVKGGMRTITGLIGRTNRQNYRLVTDVATIGIRGTEYSVRYTNSIEVFCAGGSIFVQNEGGTLVLNGGEGARVLNIQTPPTRTQEPPVLSPQGASRQSSQQAEPSEALAPPANPAQEAAGERTQEAILAQASAPPAIAPISGSFTGNWAATRTTSNESQAWIGEQVTLDASGSVTALANSFEGPFGLGTASAQSAGNDGVLAWGRWVNGTTTGGTNFYFGNRTLTSTEVMHYVVGPPVTNMPASGTAAYTMIGQTPASWTGSITAARVDASTLMVDFASLSAQLAISMTVNGQAYSAANVPLTRYDNWYAGPGDPNVSGAHFQGRAALAGLFSSNFISVYGFLSGEAASRAGLVYDASFLEQGNVRGGIAYRRN